jgi:DNA-binding CsgD family transcriptional regulator/tetratricopeptide (TPR) repeat protein
VADWSVGVIGRAVERARLAELVDAGARGPAALSLDGGAGMGKTTLWLSGLELARERGYRVLATRPAAAEAGLALAALGDLLGGVLDEVLDVLPSPQAEALRVAFLLERPRAPLDERVLAVSVLSTLRALGAVRPVLLAVDDVHWLDAASAAVLSFACRRLRDERVGVLLTRRAGESAPRALEGLERLRRVSVGPLDLDEVHRLLLRRLGVVFPLPALRRVHAVSGGNPFFALEVGRAFDRQRAMLAAGRAPPLPERLAELVAGRIAALPAATQGVLVATAALSHPTLALLTSLAGDDQVLRPAFAAHVVELDGDRLRFSHPLLAAAAHEAVDPVGRRALYRRLAGVVSDDDERARLMALASDSPDAEVAGSLERAAVRAQQRGASAVAAELCEQARRLTPPEAAAETDRRAICAARYHWAAGDTEQARAVLEEVVSRASSAEARADALTELAWVHVFQGNQRGGAELARRALVDIDGDAAMRAHALNCVATALVLMLEDLDEAARLSAEAVELSKREGDVAALSENLCGVGYVASLRGRPDADAILRRAEDLGPQAWGWRVVGWPSTHQAGVSLWTDRPDEAIAGYRRLHEQARYRGDEGSIPTVLAYLALAEFAAGRWPDAEATATDGCEAAVQAGERPNEAIALSARALVRACIGRPTDARADAERALTLAGKRSVALARIHAHWALALLDLLLDRPHDAAARLGPLRARLVAGGVGEPAAIPCVADEIEALVASGHVAAAEHAVDWLEERGRALDRASALAGAQRGRGLLAAAAGAQGAAVAAFERAVEQYARVAMPFERARTLLHLGAAQRRAKRKREARATLSEALCVFDTLGAVPWSLRAGDELARISGRRPGGSGLTATERRIAELVAAGGTNKEVAAVLFLSPRTVEAYLRQVFHKLGVRSRTELARHELDAHGGAAVSDRMGQDERDPPPKVQGFDRFGPSGPGLASALDADVPPITGPAAPHEP